MTHSLLERSVALVGSLLPTTNQHHATSQQTKHLKLHCGRSLKSCTEYSRLSYIQNLRNLQCSSLPGPKIFLGILNTLNLCSSHIVRDQVSHPYETTGKVVIHYILNLFFYLQILNRKTKDSGLNGSKHSQNLICT